MEPGAPTLRRRADGGYALTHLPSAHPAAAFLTSRIGLPAADGPTRVPAHATGAVFAAVRQGLIADPDGLVRSTFWFDTSDGTWRGFGDVPADRLTARLCAEPTPVDVPGFAGVLHPHQRTTLSRAARLDGFGCFDEMGLGKTVTGVAWVAQRLPATGRAVVLAPSSVLDQWAEAFARHLPGAPAILLRGTPARRAALWDALPAGGAAIVGYDTALADAGAALGACAGAAVVFDEAHRVRNPTARRSRLAYDAAEAARFRLALTATPVDNGAGELFALFSRLIEPGLWGTPAAFHARHGDCKDLWGVLAMRAAPFYTRHTLDDVAGTPAHRRVTVTVEPDPDLAAAHKELARTARTVLREHFSARVSDDSVSATATQMLRAAAVSPRLLHRSDAPAARLLARLLPDVVGPKVAMAVRICADLRRRGQQSVVFCAATTLHPDLVDAFEAAGLRAVRYDGGLTADGRAAAVSAFTSGHADILVASDAAAEGLNLGAHCRHSVSLDLPYTPGRVAQRGGRVWRMDTAVTSAVHVDLMCAGTLEAGLAAMLVRKRELLAAVLPPTAPAPASAPALAA